MDLNSDVVVVDPNKEVHGVNLSEPVEGVVGKVDGMGCEVVDGGMDKGLEEKGGLVVDGVDAEMKIGPADRDVDEKGIVVSAEAVIDRGDGGVRDREGLEGPPFGGGGVIAANDKWLVSESKDTRKYGTSRECVDGGVVTAVGGDHSMSFEAKLNVEIHGGDDLMRGDKVEEVAQVPEIASEGGRDQNVERVQAEEKSLDASCSMLDNVELESLGTTVAVGQITDGIPAVEVKIANNNESLNHKDLNVTHSKMAACDGLENQALEVDVEPQTNENKLTLDYVAETGVSENTENRPTLLNTVIDLNANMRKDRNVSNDVNGKSASSTSEFHVSDLVWGKVRSHPWWPGQICDPSASSEKAKKYFKKGSYLITYFGDHTFAWNEAPRIKPFLKHFSQMEKQSNMEEFQDAIACVLDEVSRRVELGLACSCISEEVYAKLKTQIIINAGIREEASRRDGGDSSLGAASFEPVKLIKFVEELAQFPYGGADRLELVTSRAQLSAFYSWKGYSQLPEFNMLGGLLENDADILVLGEKHCDEVSENALPVIKDEELVQKSKSKDNSLHKRKHISGDSMHPSKKEKILSDLVTEKCLSNPMSENRSEGRAGCKLITQSSSKKRKAVDAMADDSTVKHSKSNSSTGVDNNSTQNKQTFKVGDRICRVASQLNGLSPILKHQNATSREAAVQDEGKEIEYPSPDEMLSQLCLAAINPMKGYRFLITMITCLSEFRNAICLDRSSPEEDQLSLEQMYGGKLGKKLTKMGKKSTKSGKRSASSGDTEKSELELIKDSDCSDGMVLSMPHEQPSLKNQNENGEIVPGAPSDKDTSAVEVQASHELSPNLDSEQPSAGGDLDLEAVKPVLGSSESCEEDVSPTALILKFSDLESVPSKANLNKIFSCYGPLNESETEVLKKSSRAKVVFRRRSDAEIAFSSAGKYSTFGPSLVSYRLKYMPPTPSKASPSPSPSPSPNVTNRGRKDATALEGNATRCLEL